MMITEAEMPLEAMQKKAESHKCGVCGSPLTVAWGGAFGINSYILRCGKDIEHDILTDYQKPSKEYEEGNKLFRRLQGMDTTALMKMDTNQMLERIAKAKFPQELSQAEKRLMADISISYGLDPLMQELMIYQGNPYPTINARYRKAQETNKFDGIDTRPATVEERKTRNAKEGDYLYCAEVWVKGSSHPFVGWGRVRAAETKGSQHLPIVKDPDRQAEKRAEAMALRKAFSMPVPFQSWEEFQEQQADNIIEGKARIVDEKTGEITEEASSPEPEPEAEKTPPATKKQAPAKAKPTTPPASNTPNETDKLLAWVCEVRGFGNHDTARKFLIDKCGVSEEDIKNNPSKVREEIKDLIS